ncbi:MAG: hypothetical protein JST19_04855 [Bacteroidetes bacterium]|nr:hypothetical protein [Bacteroidota bacterium]
MMDTIEIGDLARDFYKAVSFRNSQPPQQDALTMLFYGDGILINNSFRTPIGFTAASFISALESEIAAETMSQFVMHEIHSKTDVFGKIAHRISIYEYNMGEVTAGRLPRGVNYMQFVRDEDNWRIVSVAWCDENEDHMIPAEYLR